MSQLSDSTEVEKNTAGERKGVDKRNFTWMPTLDGYVLREFFIPFFVLLFAFCILFLITDIFNDMNEFLEHKASVWTAVQYFAIRIPCNIPFIFPITILLSCMYTLANFGRHREITAMRGSGISLVRIGLPMYVIAFLVACIHFWFNEQLVPECEKNSLVMIKRLDDSDYQKKQTSQLQFMSNDKMRHWFFGYLNTDGGAQEYVKLKIYRPDPLQYNRKIPVHTIDADSADYVKGKGWNFHNAKITDFTEDGVFNSRYPAETEPYFLSEEEVPDSPSIIEKAVIQPEYLPSHEILEYLYENKNMSGSLKQVYWTLFYHRLAYPWICFFCAFLALPLAAKNERSGIFTAITGSVALMVAFYVLSEICKVMGQAGYIPPFIAGFAPTLFFAQYGVYLLKKIG